MPAENTYYTPPAPDRHAPKPSLREALRRKRTELTELGRAERSAAIVERLKALPEVATAQTVHVFWPLLDRGEVDIRPFVQWLAGQGKRIVMPVLRDAAALSADEPRMEHRLFSSEEGLVQNRWGLCEPIDGACVSIQEIDLVVVPALGVGRNGHRIGYGRGHYDEFLHSARAVSVCPIYAECVVSYILPETHDIPVSVIVSDREVIRPSLL
jgi:5-formyltetrahydrofolate cyclo-ligase